MNTAAAYLSCYVNVTTYGLVLVFSYLTYFSFFVLLNVNTAIYGKWRDYMSEFSKYDTQNHAKYAPIRIQKHLLQCKTFRLTQYATLRGVIMHRC